MRWWTVVAPRLISVHRLGLVSTGLACLARGVERPRDLRFVEAGLGVLVYAGLFLSEDTGRIGKRRTT